MLKAEQLMGIGMLLIFIGFAAVFFSMFFGAKETVSKTKVAVGGFIGFIPFGFGNDKKMVLIVTTISIALFLIWIFLNFKFTK